MAFKIFRRLSELLDVGLSSPADGEVLSYDAGTSKWINSASAGGGAPTDVNYLVGTADAGLSAEIVVGTTPGGELGGTWASPTVDTTHSGSSHASVQAAAEATAAAALSAHEADTTSVHGIADTSALVLTDDSRLTDSRTPTGSAGGVLGGTYPNPSFAADMATQAELDAHVNDTSAAHAASAISADSTTLVGTGTDVQAVLEELDNGIADHLADATAAHAASAISYAGNTNLSSTDVEAALDELDNEKAPVGAKYIVQTADSTLTNEQALGALATGIVKNTTTTGVLSIATAGTDYYNPGGTDVALADGGTGASLSDPNADRIMFWDDSAGQVTWLTPGTGLTITNTTIDASAGSFVSGELAYAQVTSDVTVTGTTEGSPTDVVSLGAVTYAATPTIIEAYVPSATNSSADGGCLLLLFDGSTMICRLADYRGDLTSASPANPMYGRIRFTPSAGSHTYNIKAMKTGGTMVLSGGAGTGGAGVYAPIYIRASLA